jgi:trimeric autotransporter adhesin
MHKHWPHALWFRLAPRRHALRWAAAGLLAAAGVWLGCDEGLVELPQALPTHWWDGFNANGMDGYVYALAPYDGQLVAGGQFRMAGSLNSPGLARWDGAAWHSLGGGFVRDDCPGTATCNPVVRALTTFGSDLVAGGRFTGAAGVGMRNVGRWDGNAWAPLGDGLEGTVLALAVYRGQLVAGGQFVASGNDSTVLNLAAWDGSRWSVLGGGANNSVKALCADGGDLYAGGDFTVAGSDSIAWLARWDGTRWDALGGGVNGSVNAIAVHQRRIVVAGSFTRAGDPDHTSNVATWDGHFWDVIPSSFILTSTLGSYGEDLVVGGAPNFSYSQYNGVGRWDGREWHAFYQGIRGTVTAICPLGEQLYVGGYFTTAGKLVSRHIARWDEPPAN